MYIQPVLVGQFVQAYFSLSCLMIQESKKKILRKKKDLGMICHTPPLKKQRNKENFRHSASVPSHFKKCRI